jgi:hypothetical protein
MNTHPTDEKEFSKNEISSEKEYRKAIRVLEQNKKPSKFLSFLMNMLEGYRQKRKMGWSRPQNKYGLNVFSSYYLFADNDQDILTRLLDIFRSEIDELSFHKSFVEELFEDPGLMGFVFCHDFDSKGEEFEGFTLSLGRKSTLSPRFRDRVDFIFESKVSKNSSNGFSRIRVYVDPFIEPIQSNPSEYFEVTNTEKYDAFFKDVVSQIEKWETKELDSRIWEHWTSRYIDYFGLRKKNITNSIFSFMNPLRSSTSRGSQIDLKDSNSSSSLKAG